MFDYFILGYFLMKEASATGELGALIKRQVFRDRLVTPVEMDLTVPLPGGGLPANSELWELNWMIFRQGNGISPSAVVEYEPCAVSKGESEALPWFKEI